MSTWVSYFTHHTTKNSIQQNNVLMRAFTEGTLGDVCAEMGNNAISIFLWCAFLEIEAVNSQVKYTKTGFNSYFKLESPKSSIKLSLRLPLEYQ